MDQSFNKKPKSYYVDYSKRRFDRSSKNDKPSGEGSRFKSTPDLGFGHQGFLITAFDEVKCYLEMRHLFEEYFDIMYNDKRRIENQKDAELNSDNPKITEEDDLEAELKDLRRKKPFKQVKTHCRNSLFINICDGYKYVDPIAIVDKLFVELAEKKELRTSNTFKVLPILDTFRGNASSAQESISAILNSRFAKSDQKKYFIEFQSRGNYKLNPEDKKEMIEAVAETISKVKPDWKVSRDQADYMVILVAFRHVCCLSIVGDYFQRRKYNITEFCKPEEESKTIDQVHGTKPSEKSEINSDDQKALDSQVPKSDIMNKHTI